MSKLIEALQIFLKYGDPYSPTHCEHDALYVMIEPADVSDGDKAKLEELGFMPDEDNDNFYSYRFGST